MDDLALALAAGLVAAFNPCGFAMLPSFLALLVSGPGGAARALRLTAAMTLGFITVFGIFGLVISVATAPIQRHLPWVTVVTGGLLIVLGVWLASGRELLLRLPRLNVGGPTGSFVGLYGYGASYAVASLSCTIAPFLAVTGLVSGSGDLLDGLAAFVAYGVGMGLVVGLLALLVALAQEAAVRKTRAVLPHVSRASGVFLLLAGVYVGYYGWYELRLNAGASADDPIVGTVTDIQGQVTTWLDALGVRWIAGAFALAVVLAMALRTHRRRKQSATPSVTDNVM
ncbi:cytochrome c biogenesis CcdA family protein [Actinomadura madurae]|uniref:cytochrome c biogenesis CcdA family protein n=1 Tax=Actinomadura madurae TaxID=1993 RepID=UPI000D8A64DD|nr:cytochrome c biogenesis protein CcdA [Actinomadura madurae]SPT51230.1 thiol:disulfide interchange protein precursor [Actinomadura madurae]